VVGNRSVAVDSEIDREQLLTTEFNNILKFRRRQVRLAKACTYLRDGCQCRSSIVSIEGDKQNDAHGCALKNVSVRKEVQNVNMEIFSERQKLRLRILIHEGEV
jgi:hypothetical protein